MYLPDKRHRCSRFIVPAPIWRKRLPFPAGALWRCIRAALSVTSPGGYAAQVTLLLPRSSLCQDASGANTP